MTAPEIARYVVTRASLDADLVYSPECGPTFEALLTGIETARALGGTVCVWGARSLPPGALSAWTARLWITVEGETVSIVAEGRVPLEGTRGRPLVTRPHGARVVGATYYHGPLT